MKGIKKGDIFYADLNPTIGSEQKGIRPVVVIQNNIGNKYSPTLVIAPITASLKKKELPTHIAIDKKLLLKSTSIILLEQLKVIDKKRLIEYIGKLDNQKINEIDNKLSNVFRINFKEETNDK